MRQKRHRPVDPVLHRAPARPCRTRCAKMYRPKRSTELALARRRVLLPHTLQRQRQRAARYFRRYVASRLPRAQQPDRRDVAGCIGNPHK
eukprot:4438627-Pleurochrysis_carterae.AAC.1